MGIQTHAYIRLLLDHSSDSSRMTITCIGQYQFVGLKAKTPEPLCAIWALGRGEIETIALDIRQQERRLWVRKHESTPLASRLVFTTLL